MKKIFYFLAVLPLSTSLLAQMADIAQTNDLTLVFEDNFADGSLDFSKWRDKPHGCIHTRLSCHSEAQYFTQGGNNLEFAAPSIMKIVAKSESIGNQFVDDCKCTDPPPAPCIVNPNALMQDGYPNLRPFYYTSSEINTNQFFQYGVFEIRAKMAAGEGLLSAFWLFGANQGGAQEITDY